MPKAQDFYPPCLATPRHPKFPGIGNFTGLPGIGLVETCFVCLCLISNVYTLVTHPECRKVPDVFLENNLNQKAGTVPQLCS